MANKSNDLAHTKWMCKYHIVFTPKYRRKVIYNQLKVDIRDILKQLCTYKGVEIIEGHLMPDHIHMLVSIPPKMSVSSFMGYLKGKSALMILDRHANLKYKFGCICNFQKQIAISLILYYDMSVKSEFLHSLMYSNCYIAKQFSQFSNTSNFHKMQYSQHFITFSVFGVSISLKCLLVQAQSHFGLLTLTSYYSYA